MTFLQSTLGKNYKWWYHYLINFRSSTAYKWSNIGWLVGRILILAFTILLWKINIDAGSILFSFSQIFTYYIVGSIFLVDNGVHFGVSQKIASGKITNKLLYPANSLFQFFIGDIGWHAYTDIFERAFFISIAIIGHEYLILPNLNNIPVFIILAIFAFVTKVYYHYLLGFLAFLITDAWGIIDSQEQIVGFLSGKILPLTSAAFLTPLTYLPFAFFYHHPMQVYFGNYSWNQSFMTIVTGLIWILVLHIATIKLWQVGLKRYEAVGL
jgi:ABC-2 type transport system permease protein